MRHDDSFTKAFECCLFLCVQAKDAAEQAAGNVAFCQSNISHIESMDRNVSLKPAKVNLFLFRGLYTSAVFF